VGCSVEGCTSPGKLTRGWCPKHYQRWRKYGTPDVYAARMCAECGEVFDPPTGNTLLCSKRCENSRRESRRKVPCSDCGKLTWPSRQREAPTCQPCRRSAPAHGTRKGYRENRCRCDLCKQWVADQWRAQYRRLRARGSARLRITPELRADIYERDDWTCRICLEPVDRDAEPLTSWYPTLDHITPQSRGGTHDPSNLRTAHHWCNLALNDGRCYSEVDFRASA
jgi:hypothetical protein